MFGPTTRRRVFKPHWDEYQEIFSLNTTFKFTANISFMSPMYRPGGYTKFYNGCE